MPLKFFGVSFFRDHHRQNQNLGSYWRPPEGIFYTHAKEASINDDRSYMEAKRFFRKHGYITRHHYHNLMRCNPEHYGKILHPGLIRDE